MPEDVRDLSEYRLPSNLRFLLGLWEAAFTASLEPRSAAGFLSPTSATQKKTTWSSWALDLSTRSLLAWALIRYKAHH